MHNALPLGKGELHNVVHYPHYMDDPADRLRIARLRAGFSTAKDAAEAMGIPVQTYLAHENGSRGINAARAAQYAKRYKVPEVWLLYGTGPAPGAEDKSETAEVVSIIQHLPPIRREEALRYLRFLAESNGG